MRRLLLDFWRGEDGTAVGPEWLLVASVMVLGSSACVFLIHRLLLRD